MKNNIFPINYTSLDIFKTKKNKIQCKINKNKQLKKDDVKKNFVVVKVQYSNINYKDFLMFQGRNGLVTKFPHTAGIDACGTICYSNSKKFKIKDKVFVIARPLGVQINGSFSEYITIPDLWAEKLPKNLTSKEIMMIGTSGFTAVKALNKSLKTIIKYKNKPVLITGALSNVGMFIIFFLTHISINVEAVTSQKKNVKILKKMGVTKIHILKNFVKIHNYSLLNEKYSAVFENLGGEVIPVCLKYLIKNGILISIGNILGNISTINILPLILREVSILSVNAESTSTKERRSILRVLESLSFKKKLLNKTKVISLQEVSELMNLKKYHKKNMRYIVKI
jgi:putative YhdH/YhfP family quinone oxidoreductase